ncbi:hypothetical protein [Echinicola shivajiensis]|uniref:hypothetical protein n=1 Tax=Echinicola shivajiensis TaxID=1035916 RepID=UPI001FEA8E91|nr:hypothetical protein [Echinicola shivajiensis]
MNRNFLSTQIFLLLFIAFTVSSCFTDSEVDERIESIKAAKRPVGASSNEILSADKFSSINLEIQYMEGFPPDQASIEAIANWIATLVNKPTGLNVSISSIPALGQENYSLDEIREIEDNNRNSYNTGSELGMYILIVDGYFDQDTDNEFSLGFSHRNTSLTLLGQRILENSGRIGKPSKEKLETTVLEHELGHLMGLVNLGSIMQVEHEDEEHDHHCDNRDCLMYWAVETNILYNSVNNGIPSLDENCLNDLKANGGK